MINRKKGITLLELICVMTVLATVLSFSAPMLSRFFRGRTLNEETRRFLALTRYARSEAISRSMTMQLWIEPENGRYGLEPQSKYDQYSNLEYQLSDSLNFDPLSEEPDDEGRLFILFMPDGSIDEESLDRIAIRESKQDEIVVERSDSGLEYVVTEEEQEHA